jgi:hypothetical protein
VWTGFDWLGLGPNRGIYEEGNAVLILQNKEWVHVMCYYKISRQPCTKALGKGTEQDVKPKIVDCSFRSRKRIPNGYKVTFDVPTVLMVYKQLSKLEPLHPDV